MAHEIFGAIIAPPPRQKSMTIVVPRWGLPFEESRARVIAEKHEIHSAVTRKRHATPLPLPINPA